MMSAPTRHLLERRAPMGIRAAFLLVLLISACSPSPGSGRSDALPSPAQERDPVVRLDTYLQAQAGRGFSGVVLVARDGEIILNRAYSPNGTALDSSTAFWIASNSKQFSAAAVLRLTGAGSSRQPAGVVDLSTASFVGSTRC